MAPVRTSLFVSLSSYLLSRKKYLLVTSHCSQTIQLSLPTPSLSTASSPLSRPEGSARRAAGRSTAAANGLSAGGGPAPRRDKLLRDNLERDKLLRAARCAELAVAMATVREKAAALSMSAACSPVARPPGTGR